MKKKYYYPIITFITFAILNLLESNHISSRHINKIINISTLILLMLSYTYFSYGVYTTKKQKGDKKPSKIFISTIIIFISICFSIIVMLT